MLPRQNRSPASPPDIKSLSLSVSFKGWRFPNTNYKTWAIKMSSLHKPTWIQAGIFEAVMSSTKVFTKDTDLLLGIAERWCPGTNTFVLPWGEATVTLEDVSMLLGFSVLGSPVFTALDSSGERVKEELVKESLEIKKVTSFVFVSQVEWVNRFMNSGDELEHVAFLALWLSYFVFPSACYHIDEAVFSVAVHLSRGTRIALAPAVLAHLYAELTLLKRRIREFTVEDRIELKGLFKLVQVWTWERFKELRPEKPNKVMLKGEQRLSLWYDDGSRRKRSSSSNVREALEESKVESFEWRPYTKALENWRFPLFYPEDAMWVPVDADLDDEFITFARCVKVSKLVGIDCVEDYFPSRVAAQFGLIQDVVTCRVDRKRLSREAAWDEYNKPIDELTLYIPSRCSIPWWKKSSSEWWKKLSSAKENQAVESAESSMTPRNIIGDDDDDDTSDSVASDCKRWKSMKQLCEDDEDDSLTVAQVMRLRKKSRAMCSSDENYSSDLPKVLLLSEVLKKLGDGFPEKLKISKTRRNVRSEINIGDWGGSAASREVSLGDLCENYSSDPPKVLLLREVLKKLGDGFPENLKRSRTRRSVVRSEIKEGKIGDWGGSAALREVSLGDLCDKELVKRKSGYLGKKRALEDDLGCYDNVINAENIRVKTVVAPQEIKQESEETENRSKAANENNSLDPPLLETHTTTLNPHNKKNRAMCPSDENYSSDNSKVLLLSEVLQKLGDGFPEKLKRSRTRRDDVRSEIKKGKIEDCGGSAASREVPLGDLCGKELVKVKSEYLEKNRAREDGNESGMDCYDNVTNAKKIRVKTVVSPREIKQESEETETRSKTANQNNSLYPPVGAKIEVVEPVVSPPETMQRNNALEELALTLEARMMKVEKTLAKIREWKTIEVKGAKNGVSV